MERPQVVVAVIVVNGTLLLLDKGAKTGQWTLPKRAVSKFQTVEDAGRRAVLEATGVSVDITGSLFVSEEIIPPDVHDIAVITLGKLIGDGILSVSNGPAQWVDFRDLSKIQGDVDNLTADSLMKFGLYLQSKARGV